MIYFQSFIIKPSFLVLLRKPEKIRLIIILLTFVNIAQGWFFNFDFVHPKQGIKQSNSSAFTKYCMLMSELKISSVAGCRYKQIYLKYEWWCLKHHIWWVGRVATSPEMHRTLQRDSRMCLWGAPSDPDQLILLWNMYFPNLHSLHR